MKQQILEQQKKNARASSIAARNALEDGIENNNLELLMEALNHVNRTIALLEED